LALCSVTGVTVGEIGRASCANSIFIIFSGGTSGHARFAIASKDLTVSTTLTYGGVAFITVCEITGTSGTNSIFRVFSSLASGNARFAIASYELTVGAAFAT